MNNVRDYIAKKMGGSSVDDEDDDKPYDSIARAGANISDDDESDDSSDDSVSMPAASALRAPSSSPGSNLMDDYNKQEAAVRGIRQQNLDRNADVGIYRALGQLASAGGTAPTQTGVYDALTKQNDAQAAAATSDLGRRATVMKAIQQNQLKQAGLDIQTKKADETNDINKQRLDAYNKRTDTMGGAQSSRLDANNVRSAAGLFKDPNINKEVTKLNSAKSAQTLIDEIRSGNLVDSKSVKNQLTNILTTIELGSPGGQGDRHAMGVDNLYSKAQDALSFLESNPKSSLTKETLDQLEKEAHALGDRASRNYKSLTDAALSGSDLSGGDPDADAGKIHALGKQRQQSFLKSAGYDPETGESLRAKAPAGKPGVGSIINVKGKRYRVGADGDSLEPI